MSTFMRMCSRAKFQTASLCAFRSQTTRALRSATPFSSVWPFTSEVVRYGAFDLGIIDFQEALGGRSRRRGAPFGGVGLRRNSIARVARRGHGPSEPQSILARQPPAAGLLHG